MLGVGRFWGYSSRNVSLINNIYVRCIIHGAHVRLLSCKSFRNYWWTCRKSSWSHLFLLLDKECLEEASGSAGEQKKEGVVEWAFDLALTWWRSIKIKKKERKETKHLDTVCVHTPSSLQGNGERDDFYIPHSRAPLALTKPASDDCIAQFIHYPQEDRKGTLKEP